MYVSLVCRSEGGHPPLERHMSDFGPRRETWGGDGWGGGGGRRGDGGGGDWGRRRSTPVDSGPPMSAEDWSKPLARNERTER